jgi:hypothetical protein
MGGRKTPLGLPALLYEHAVTIRIEAIAVGYRVTICAEYILFSS